ncbi:MAG TPA: hypothetical protein VI431_00800 [Candidatus Acidoferrum sp.]
MKNNYFTRKAFEAGLNGEKPSIIQGQELYDAQMEGYKTYLGNKDLADRIADEEEERSREREGKRAVGEYLDTLSVYERARSNDSHEAPTPPPPKPVTGRQRVKWIGWAIFLVWLDYEIATSFIGWMARTGVRDFQPPSRQAFAFFIYFFIFPGYFFLSPAVNLLKDAKNKKFR